MEELCEGCFEIPCICEELYLEYLEEEPPIESVN